MTKASKQLGKKELHSKRKIGSLFTLLLFFSFTVSLPSLPSPPNSPVLKLLAKVSKTDTRAVGEGQPPEPGVSPRWCGVLEPTLGKGVTCAKGQSAQAVRMIDTQ